ncbi:DUF6115 domain-containing protein [Piscibacillus halophilus]|uniref:Swarming motility protein SwrB n=1 Tax=Piscibacillus halophilus TaxID=571933 RepID=A0A1H8Z0K1_9BACI|nr:hypothetical protein [Piscibacillus halophilus]SEP57893.1 hypothetical protein SAMN05216362_101161 [Piscibacillus halophilus]
MNSFLMLLSLLLHGVSFVVIFKLYQKVQNINSSDAYFEQKVKETEDMLNSYLLEIKDENEKFIHKVSKLETSDTDTFNHDKVDSKTNDDYEKINQEDQDDVPVNMEQPSDEAQILYLFDQGYTIEEIAKKLNKGNTEVDLIVKFNQKIHY